MANCTQGMYWKGECMANGEKCTGMGCPAEAWDEEIEGCDSCEFNDGFHDECNGCTGQNWEAAKSVG